MDSKQRFLNTSKKNNQASFGARIKENLVLLLLPCIFLACFPEDNGCTDIFATNFDLQADILCDDCCTYPRLRLDSRVRYEEDILNPTDTIFDQNAQGLIILDIGFSSSGLNIDFDNGHSWEVDKSLEYSGMSYPSDLEFWEMRSDISFADFADTSSVSQINMVLGPESHFIDGLRSDFVSDIDIKNRAQIWEEDRLQSCYLRYVNLKEGMADTSVLKFQFQELPLSFPLDTSFEIGTSRNLEFTLDIDSIVPILFENDSLTLFQEMRSFVANHLTIR